MSRRLIAALKVVLAVSLAACTVDANYSAAGFKCSAEESCQPGFTCVAGLCQAGDDLADAAPLDASVDSMAQVDASPDADLACLPKIALSDDFVDPAVDPQWQAVAEQPGTSLEETGGVLIMTPASSLVAPRFAYYRSLATFDFDGKRLFVELSQMVDPATQAYAQLRLRLDDQNYFVIEELAGSLRFGVVVSGARVNVATVAFDAPNHRFWQYKVSAGSIYAETSADGETWSSLGESSTGDIVGNLAVELRVSTNGSVAAPGALHVANVNIGHDCR